MQRVLTLLVALTAAQACMASTSAANNAHSNTPSSIKLTQEQPAPPELLDPFDAHGLNCSLALDMPVYDVGEDMTVTVTLTCSYNGRRLFNPFFHGLIEKPGRLRIFDDTGKFIKDFFSFEGGSLRGPGDEDWVYLSDHQFLGFTTTVHLEPLPPGHYKAQLVLHDTIELGELYQRPKGHENLQIVAASEPVPFQVTPKK